MPILFLIVFIVFGTLTPLHAQALEWSGVATQKTIESLRFEAFNISATEPIGTYGYRLCRFLSPHLYWGGACHSGILGIRGGWFTGGLIAGYTGAVGDSALIYDLGGFFGGGGGGSAPQGGGMVGKAEASLGWHLDPSFEALVSTGYNHFFNGSISSPYLGFEVRNIFYELDAH